MRRAVRGRCLIAAAVAALSSCAHAPAPASLPPRIQAADADEAREVTALAAEVARARGGAWRASPTVAFLDGTPFLAAVRTAAARDSERVLRLLAPVLAGFAEGRDAGAAPVATLKATFEDILDEQVAGFYDDAAHVLYVRRGMARGAADVQASIRTWIIAHELGHAWQDQTVGFATHHAGRTLDEQLAIRAAYEGDASLTATLVLARRAGRDVDAAVLEQRRVFASMSSAELAQLGGRSPKLVAAPPLTRELVLFPYVAGARFALDLHATGGLALVDRVMAAPPRSTRAILHVQEYLDGAAGPAAVPAPPSDAVLGERLTAVVLGRCLPAARAERLAAALEADDFLLVPGQGLVWRLSASRPADAQAISEALGTGPRRCLAPLPGRTLRTRLDGPRLVVTEVETGEARADGSSDGGARGDGGPIRPARVSPPFGTLRVPTTGALSAEERSGRGTISNHRWTSERLGVTTSLPADADARLDLPSVELAVTRAAPRFLQSSLVFLETPPTDTQAELAFRAIVLGALRGSAVREADVHQVADGPVDLGWTRGRQREWRVGADLGLRARILEACAGRASWVVLESWRTDEGREAAEALLRAVRVIDPRPPACRALPSAAATR